MTTRFFQNRLGSEYDNETVVDLLFPHREGWKSKDIEKAFLSQQFGSMARLQDWIPLHLLRKRPAMRILGRRPVFPFSRAAWIGLFALAPAFHAAAGDEPDLSYGRDMMIAAFEHEIGEISSQWFDGVETLADWQKRRIELRERFADMLGLRPEPDRTDMQVTVTGETGHELFTVQNLHFQSLPGLYVTANLYIPKNLNGPVPGVLYVCGHASRVIDGYSYGSKLAYHRHPAWYARHGMVSLIIDPLNNGEVRGNHRGTNRRDRWWWYNRGYTPAAIEAWNTIRALDYLESLDTVDPDRIGVTGRSGGGMYSWLLLALDDRVAVSTPTAGIADLYDHIVDGVIRGHCDCNYWNNFHRFDTTVMAALAAPRPVRLVNTDDDPIFPTAGIHRIDEQVRKFYALYGKEDRWDVFIGSGGHSDTSELHEATFPWMYRWLKDGKLGEIAPAEEYFEPEDLRVFAELPADERNTRIDREFLRPRTVFPLPRDRREWEEMVEDWMNDLAEKPFAGWPDEPVAAPQANIVFQTEIEGLDLTVFEFSPQEKITLRLWAVREKGAQPGGALVRVADEVGWNDWVALLRAAAPDDLENILGPGGKALPWPDPAPGAVTLLKDEIVGNDHMLFIVAPRGIGPTHFERAGNRGDTIRRSFPLLGQTRDGMRVWDVRRALGAIRGLPEIAATTVRVEAQNQMSTIVLYASLFDSPTEQIDVRRLPTNHDNGPYLLNIDHILNTPQLLAMARARTEVRLHETDPADWTWSDQALKRSRR